MKIYIARVGKRYGPYSRGEIETFLGNGSVLETDFAWAEGCTDWIPLRDLLKPSAGSADVANSGEIADSAEKSEAVKGSEPDAIANDTPLSRSDGSNNQEVPLESGDCSRVIDGSARDEETGATPKVAAGPESAQTEHEKCDIGTLQEAPSQEHRKGSISILPKIFLAVAVIAFASIALLFWISLPEGVTVIWTDRGLIHPKDGYEFIEPDKPLSWKVRWVPGKPSVLRKNWVAGRMPQSWRPAPGFVVDENDAVGLRWSPSKREDEFPHVQTASEPGKWIPDPGYEFHHSATSLEPKVVWRKGIKLPRMVSADREGYWILEPGYAFSSDSTKQRPRAVWAEGLAHPRYPNISSAESEGMWQLDPGYQWVAPGEPDLRTFNLAATARAWNTAGEIDKSTVDLDCSSEATFWAAVERARDRYAALGSEGVHPRVASHFRTVATVLEGGIEKRNTCMVMENAGGGADIVASVLCMFSEKSWQQCMDESAGARKVIDVAGKVSSWTCAEDFRQLGLRFDELWEERLKLEARMESLYGLGLSRPSRMVLCHQE